MNEHRHLFGHLRAESPERPAGIVAPGAIGPLRFLAAIGAVLVDCVTQAIGTILTWLDRYRQRRILEGLGDYMLKDIGVSRADVDRESSKQFWRE